MKIYNDMISLLSKRERVTVGVIICTAVLVTILEMLGIAILSSCLVQIGTGNLQNAFLPTSLKRITEKMDPNALSIVGMLSLIGTFLLKNCFQILMLKLQTSFVSRLRVRLSLELFESYLCQPYAFHLQKNSAELTRNLVQEVDNLTGFYVPSALQLCVELILIVGIICALLVADPISAISISILLGTLAFICIKQSRENIAKYADLRQQHDSAKLKCLQQGLGAIKEILLLDCRHVFIMDFSKHTSKSANAVGQYQFVQQLPRMFLELIVIISLSLWVIFMSWTGKGTENLLPIIGIFAASALRLMPSISKMVAAVQGLRFGRPSLNIVCNELKKCPVEPITPDINKSIINFDKFCAKSISFTYSGNQMPTIDSVSFEINSGETIGFIGPSGAGKSTLMDIFLGVLSPSSGSITVNGKSIYSDIRAWKKNIGYVPQSLYLTDDTLTRNVAFGVPDAEVNLEMVRLAIRDAQLEDFVRNLPNGMNTRVGERGIRLSGGQKQRISIARALYRDPSILVLDEATSSLDLNTEAEIIKVILGLKKKKTVLIVAHRLSTVEICDRIYHIKSGKIFSSGSANSIIFDIQNEQSKSSLNKSLTGVGSQMLLGL